MPDSITISLIDHATPARLSGAAVRSGSVTLPPVSAMISAPAPAASAFSCVFNRSLTSAMKEGN